jgi:hypothetical protein
VPLVILSLRGAIRNPSETWCPTRGTWARGAERASGFCGDPAATWTTSRVAQYLEQEQKGPDQREWEQNDHEQKATQKQAGR